jgi:DNA-binding transcriptional ArsR family regulator
MQSTQLTDRADPSLSTETIFETLSNRRRRYALHYLKRVGEPVTIRDLSEQLAAWENDVDRARVRPKQRKRLYTALHQTHLPKMNELGVVDYDRDRGVVALTAAIEEFDIYFDLVGKDDIPWSQFYLALGGVFTSLVTVAMLGIPPFAWIGGFAYGLVVAVAFSAVAAYHVFRDRRRVVGSADAPPEPVSRPARGPANPEALDD